MFQIDIKDVQAIGEARIVFEDNSIVEFTGDNSNGKSIISKVIQSLTSGDIRHKDTRLTLIKDGTEQGVVLFTHDNEQLGILMRPETKDSFIMYIPDLSNPSEKILRAMNDPEGCDALVKRFGFRTYAGGDICLQLSPTWGAIPFITTSGSVNNDIVEDITVDKVADEFLKTFSTITFPVFKDKIARLKRDRDNAQAILDNMESYDWRAYEKLAEEMRELWLAMKEYEFIEIEDLAVPNLSIIPYQSTNIKDIPIVRFYDYGPTIIDVNKSLNDYIQIMNGVCPTCGTPLKEV